MTQAANHTGKCKLCMQNRVLQKSHVIPRFVRKAAKTTSTVEDPRYYTAAGGKFLTLEQDLPKKTWLCKECEQLLSRSEKHFAESVYHRIWTGQTRSGSSNNEHVHRFLVSMAWRTWHWYYEHEAQPFSSASNEARLREAEEVWRTYLLGERKDVGEFQQHILMQSGQMANSAGRTVGLHSYYWARGFNLDILGHGKPNEEILMVYAKIPKLAMFGMVEQQKSGCWHGTLVEPGLGDTWSGQKATVPEELIQYLTKQGEKSLAILSEVPKTVKRKTGQRMDTLIEHEGDDYLERDAVRSLVSDDLMELPEESILYDALLWAEKNSDPRAQRICELLSRLSEAEIRSLHQETNRVAIRCKALSVEEGFSLLADGGEETMEPGMAILVGVEVFRTQERAMEMTSLPLIFGLNEEDVAVAIGVEVVAVPKNLTARGIRYVA